MIAEIEERLLILLPMDTRSRPETFCYRPACPPAVPARMRIGAKALGCAARSRDGAFICCRRRRAGINWPITAALLWVPAGTMTSAPRSGPRPTTMPGWRNWPRRVGTLAALNAAELNRLSVRTQLPGVASGSFAAARPRPCSGAAARFCMHRIPLGGAHAAQGRHRAPLIHLIRDDSGRLPVLKNMAPGRLNAWLIQRFIDPSARFLWLGGLRSARRCPGLRFRRRHPSRTWARGVVRGPARQLRPGQEPRASARCMRLM